MPQSITANLNIQRIQNNHVYDFTLRVPEQTHKSITINKKTNHGLLPKRNTRNSNIRFRNPSRLRSIRESNTITPNVSINRQRRNSVRNQRHTSPHSVHSQRSVVINIRCRLSFIRSQITCTPQTLKRDSPRLTCKITKHHLSPLSKAKPNNNTPTPASTTPAGTKIKPAPKATTAIPNACKIVGSKLILKTKRTQELYHYQSYLLLGHKR